MQKLSKVIDGTNRIWYNDLIKYNVKGIPMKKIICFMLCFCCIASICSFGALNAHGVEETAVYISTVEELIDFSNDIATGRDEYVGKIVYLENDIVINEGNLPEMSQIELNALTNQWGSISSNFGFKGTFDGQGHSISGVYLCSEAQTATGLFGSPSDNSATVKNLRIEKSVVIAGNNYSGVLFGSCNGNISLQNLYIDADLRTEYSYCGGLLGYTRKPVSISSCVFAGTIEAAEGTKQIGGLVGSYGSETLSISNSAFLGTISGNAKDVGGLVGRCYKDQLFITNCISMGTITSTEASVAAFVGGTAKAIHLTNNLYTQDLAPVGIETGGSVSSETAASSATKVASADLYGAEAMSTLADFGFFVWKANKGMTVLPATVADMMAKPEASTPSAPTQFVGYQIAVGETDDVLHLRLVAVVDSSQYEAVGFSVTLQNEVLGTKSYSTPTKTVYRTLSGYGAEGERIDYTAEGLGGKYIFALNVKNIPVENGVYTFTVSTYHVLGGETIPNGEAKQFTLDASQWQEG